ncbi:MAG: hypothetical protein ACHQ52_09065 [Candidatus Eisenbacteria bacterium]
MVPRLRTLVMPLLLVAPAVAGAVPARTPTDTRASAAATPMRDVVTLAVPRTPGATRLDPARTRVANPTRFDPIRSCATRLDGAATLVREHATRAASSVLPSPHTADVGDIAVLEDDGTFFYTHSSGHAKVDLQEVSRAFYRSHGDDYDAIAVFLASGLTDWMGSETAFASCDVVRNDVDGIGLDRFDESATMGSAGRLSALLDMNGMHLYLDDPNANITALGLNLSGLQTIGHELEHRWGAYVAVESLGAATYDLLGRDYAHWNFWFDSDASVLEGCDWAAITPDSFATDEVEDRYGRLDQYVMGLRKPDQVGPLLLVTQPDDIVPPGNYLPKAIPEVGVGCHAVPRWMSIDDVVAANGPREPAAPDTLPLVRVAFVLAIPRGTTASAGDLARLDSLRARFVPWFETATEGRGWVDTRLAPTPPRLLIMHTPLPATEDVASPRAIGARVRLVGGNLPVTLDDASVVAHWRPVGAASTTDLPMTLVAPDSFATTLPAFAGDAEYTLTASTIPPLVSATEPEGGGVAFRYHAGPDVTPPVVTHVPVPLQTRWRLPQTLIAKATDDLGVDSVWVEYAVDGGDVQSVPVTSAGIDSFAVQLGAGLARGDRVAYRFVARDVSTAHNIGYSNAEYDTMVVGRDWMEDFDNGAALAHGAAIWSFRDAWHPETDPIAPQRGTSMHCGDADGGAYAPHLDAALYTSWLYGIPPGVVLQFDHRFDLEEADAQYAYDGALVEYSTDGSTWSELTPPEGYDHVLAVKLSVLPASTPVWSGNSRGWRTELLDLSPLGSGPAILCWRMLADEFIGRDGWWVDHVRLIWPDGTTDVPLANAPGAPRAWPNPARDALSMTLPAGLAGDGVWELYDVAGRRVSTLWRGRFGISGATLRAAIPDGIAPGLYFARLSAGARVVTSARVAVVR